jgi:UDP-N-acetylglucosamine:LPS N-acetylglucosamine transferase
MITLLFAGGGTGGHLYPGLAIAAELRARGRVPVRAVFICSDRPLDREILEKAGVEFIVTRARPLSTRLTAAVRFMSAWGASVRQVRRTIREHRAGQEGGSEPNPVLVVAMGGFVAAPAVQAALAERCPVALVNLDAVPGKANRWVARRVPTIYSAVRVRPGTGLPESVVTVPPIVRAQAASTGPAGRAECRRRLGLDPAAPVLMVTGGSQGAKSINDFVTAFALSDVGQHALKLDPVAAGAPAWQVLHQTGKEGDSAVAESYKKAGLKAVVRPFADAMGDWWGAADLAIARAGAGNVGEVWANKVPTVFMPYPFHKDEHQRFNAAVLEEAGGARIVRDQVEAKLNLEAIGPVLRSLIESSEIRRQMWAALEKLGPADGAARIAQALIESITPAAGYAR